MQEASEDTNADRLLVIEARQKKKEVAIAAREKVIEVLT